MIHTKKTIVDSISNILTRFKPSDEFRVPAEWLNYKIDEIRASLITTQYLQTQQIDHTWLSSPIKLALTRTNWSDDNTIICGCDVSKTTIPQTISLVNKDANLDLGLFRATSLCGTKQFFFQRMSRWNSTPAEHTNSLFKYYDRYNTVLFTNDPNATAILIVPILLTPEDGFLTNSNPVLSGSLVSGTVYVVKYGQVIYKGIPYAENSTFTADSTAVFTGTGKVYLNSQLQAYKDTDPYPASGEMIRQIEFEILTKEFKIEAGELTDVRNDSVDDANKVPAV